MGFWNQSGSQIVDSSSQHSGHHSEVLTQDQILTAERLPSIWIRQMDTTIRGGEPFSLNNERFRTSQFPCRSEGKRTWKYSTVNHVQVYLRLDLQRPVSSCLPLGTFPKNSKRNSRRKTPCISEGLNTLIKIVIGMDFVYYIKSPSNTTE